MIDLKTLSEMPSVKEMMQRHKKPRCDITSTTVTAVGSPLTDPNGVKEGRYSYSETGGIPDGMTQEEYDKAMKEFMEFSEMTPEQIEEMLDTMSKTTSPIKESSPMTRREELETKGISQLMAERFARGVPTGAFSKSTAFEKGGQPRTPFENEKDLEKGYADAVVEMSGREDFRPFAQKDAELSNAKTGKGSATVAALKNKAIEKDAEDDKKKEQELNRGRDFMAETDYGGLKSDLDVRKDYFKEFIMPYVDAVRGGKMNYKDAIAQAGSDFSKYMSLGQGAFESEEDLYDYLYGPGWRTGNIG